MRLRTFHRTVGLISGPFFIITAVTGAVLLWRKAGVYSSETKGSLLGWHNWEGAAKYLGVILAVLLLAMTLTGLLLAIKSMKRKR